MVPYIHQLADWPRLTWSSETIASQLADVRHRQGVLLGKMTAVGREDRSEASLVALTREVLTTSAIEGEELPWGEVRSSLATRLGLERGGLPRPGRDVEGITEVMVDATREHAGELTAERLFAWHAALFPTGMSGMRRIAVGAWRTGPMEVVSGPYGKERVHFEAPPARSLPDEMAAFLRWSNGAPETDPVLRAAIAHLWFVTIHPFDDGNGRIARAIADMMLARSDGTGDRYYSMSAQILEGRKSYYAQLERTQRGGLDITSWLVWFLGCLKEAIDAASASLAWVMYAAQTVRDLAEMGANDRQIRVVIRMTNAFKGHMHTKKYAALAKCSPATARRDIEELVRWGVFAKNDAGGRSTSYRLAGSPEGGPGRTDA